MTQQLDDSAKLLEQVCALLHLGHGKASQSPIDTLNRLFRKHLVMHKPEIADGAPYLQPDNVALGCQQWTTDQLWKILPDTLKLEADDQSAPRHEKAPLVVVHFRGADCIIDGRRRISQWKRQGVAGSHTVWRITVINQL